MSSNIRILININYIWPHRLLYQANYLDNTFVFQSFLMDGAESKNFLSEDFLDSTLALPSPALITPLPANIFSNRLAPYVPNSILRNHPFCSFASFLIVSLTPSNNNPESPRDLTVFKMSVISSFDVIKVIL